MSQYIKVTPKGENKSYIVMAHLKDFYLSQGAKIEKPTEEEIRTAFPFESGAKPQQETQKLDNLLKDVEKLEKELSKVRDANNKLIEEREALKEKVSTLQAERDEAEQLVQRLRAKNQKAAESKKD